MDELLQISRRSLENAVANSGSYIALCTRLLAIFAAWKSLWFLVAVWVYYVGRRFEAGLRRSLACLPAVVVLLNATPVLVDRCSMPLLVVPFMAMMSLSSFKVAAFALGRGPLAMPHSAWYNSLPKFAAVMGLPIIPTAALTPRQPTRTRRESYSSANSDKPITTTTHVSTEVPTSPITFSDFCQALAWQITFLALSAYIARQFWLPNPIRHWCYALLLALELEWVWNWYGWVAYAVFGLEPARAFIRPWFSESLAEYWARRWNLPTTHMLRVLIYDPIIENRLVAAPKPEVAAAATLAVAVDATAQPPAAAQAAGSPTAAAAASDVFRTTSDESTASQGSAGSTTEDHSYAHAANAMNGGIASSGLRRRGLNINGAEASFKDWTSGESVAGAAAGTAAADGARLDDRSKQVCSDSPLGDFKTKRPSMLKRYVAMQASFAFSGAWHTLIFYYATAHWIPHWFAFFALQAPTLVFEDVLRKFMRKNRITVPSALAVIVCNAALLVFGVSLFCEPIDRLGLSQAWFDSITGVLQDSEWARQCRAQSLWRL